MTKVATSEERAEQLAKKPAPSSSSGVITKLDKTKQTEQEDKSKKFQFCTIFIQIYYRNNPKNRDRQGSANSVDPDQRL